MNEQKKDKKKILITYFSKFALTPFKNISKPIGIAVYHELHTKYDVTLLELKVSCLGGRIKPNSFYPFINTIVHENYDAIISFGKGGDMKGVIERGNDSDNFNLINLQDMDEKVQELLCIKRPCCKNDVGACFRLRDILYTYSHGNQHTYWEFIHVPRKIYWFKKEEFVSNLSRILITGIDNKITSKNED